MSNLPSLPSAGSDPWELHLAAFGRVERCDEDICDSSLLSWASQLESPSKRKTSTCSTNSHLKGI